MTAPRRRRGLVPAALAAAFAVSACAGLEQTAAPATPSPTVDPSAPTPAPTWWPNPVVAAILALGSSDPEIQLAGNDFLGAAETQDLELLLRAADGLAELILAVEPNVDRIRNYAETAELARLYDVAFPDMLAGARQISAALRAGDAEGVVAGSRLLSRGLAAYGEVRSELGPLVERALFMQRILVK